MAKRRKPLRGSHLAGKRRWSRQPRSFEVVCAGAGATVQGRTIDISRGGMLFEAHPSDLALVDEGDLVPLAYLVAAAFAQGMKAIFGAGVSVAADVVRVTTSPVDRAFLRLGCRFRRTLTCRQCAQIGIDETDVPDPSLDIEPELDGDATTSIRRGGFASDRDEGSDP